MFSLVLAMCITFKKKKKMMTTVNVLGAINKVPKLRGTETVEI